MNKKIIGAVSVIALGCIIMLIWAWQTGDFVLVITMAVALVLICGVGILPVIFNTKGRTKRAPVETPTITVRDGPHD